MKQYTKQQNKDTFEYYKTKCNISTQIDINILETKLNLLGIKLTYDKKDSYFNDLNNDFKYKTFQLYPICKKSNLNVYNTESDFYKNQLTYKTKEANDFRLIKDSYFSVVNGFIVEL